MLSRTKMFPTVCEEGLKRIIEGDASTEGTVFNASNFCKMQVSKLPVPHLVPCKDLEKAPKDAPRCNRLERFVGKKLRMFKVSFKSSCHGTFEIQEQ